MSKRSELLKQRYAQDPEYRESLLAGNRARYDNRKDEINAQKRLRYATVPSIGSAVSTATRPRSASGN